MVRISARGASGAGEGDAAAIYGGHDAPKDTRLRVQDEEPTGDEDRDFKDMLAQFKKVGIHEAQVKQRRRVAKPCGRAATR